MKQGKNKTNCIYIKGNMEERYKRNHFSGNMINVFKGHQHLLSNFWAKSKLPGEDLEKYGRCIFLLAKAEPPICFLGFFYNLI